MYKEDLSIHQPKLDITVIAASDPNSEEFVPLSGHIKAELDSIIRISVAQNKEEKIIDGYVIRVYTGNSRDRANQIWTEVDSSFPELAPKISYHQPNFRVKAGRFTDRLEAYRVFQQVKEDFPRAQLVPERFTMNDE
jgi:hypothetical protein